MLDCVAHRAEEVAGRLGPVLDGIPFHRLRTRWLDPERGWLHRLGVVAQEAANPPELRMVLAGSTGAGKSTLLNALLGTRLLPVSTVRPCTAAVTELRWADIDGFRARVRFVPRRQWEEQLRRWQAELQTAPAPAEAAGARLQRQQVILDQLGAVYGAAATHRFASGEGRSVLAESEAVANLLDRTYLERTVASPPELRSALRDYVDASGALWPLVVGIEVHGRLDLPDRAIVPVDLPGLNDPKIGLEMVARSALASAHFVVVVFNTSRGLTRDIVDVLVDGGLVRDLFLGGRVNDLAFVGTHAEAFDPGAAAEELGLPADAPIGEVALARGRAVTVEVHRQLDAVAALVAERAGLGDPEAQALARSLRAAPVITVAAVDHLRALGQAPGHPGVFPDPSNTGVDDLRRHVADLGRRFGARGLCERLDEQVDAVIREVRRARAAHRGGIARADALAAGRFHADERALLDGMDHCLARAVGAHNQQGTTVLDDADGRLQGAAAPLCARIEAAVDGWRDLNALRFRVAVERGGRSDTLDLAGLLRDEVLDTLLPVWSDVIERVAREPLGTVEQAARCGEEAVIQLRRAAERAGVPAEALAELVGDAGLHGVRRRARSRLSLALRNRLREAGTAVRAHIDELIGSDLARACEEAAREQGKGAHPRRVRVLRRRVRQRCAAWGAVSIELLEEALADELARSAEEIRASAVSEVHDHVTALADALAVAIDGHDTHDHAPLDVLGAVLDELPGPCDCGPARS